jgi:hypothetical protein
LQVVEQGDITLVAVVVLAAIAHLLVLLVEVLLLNPHLH